MTMNQTNPAPAPQNPTPMNPPPTPPPATPPPAPPKPVTPPPPPPPSQKQPPAPQPMPKREGGGVGAVTAIIIIVILLVVGGIYYLMTQTSMLAPTIEEALPTMQEVQASDDPDVQAAMTQSTSDEVSAIEADVNATDMSGIDEAMAGLDAEVAQ